MWRYKWYVLTAALLAAGVAYGLSTLRATLYEAEGVILLDDPRSSGGIADEIGLVLDPRRYVRNQATIIESPQVAQRVVEKLDNGTTPRQVQDATAAIPAADLDAVTVRAVMPTAVEATTMVNALVEAYEEIITETVRGSADQSIATIEASRADTAVRIAELDVLIIENPGDSALEARRVAAINQLVALDTRVELLSTNVALYGSGVQLYVAPDTPMEPIQPKPIRNAAVAFIVGLGAAGAWAWSRADKHKLAVNRDTPASVLDAPLLAVVPEFGLVNVPGPAPTVTDPNSIATEAYQFALSSLGFALEGVHGNSVVITSVAAGDGKTATALNLAVAAVHDGRNPLLIDADERVGGLTTLSDLASEAGVLDLNGPGNTEQSIHRWSFTDGTELDIVPAGSASTRNTASFFRSEGFRGAFSHLLEGRDIVIVDSPPVLAVAETADISAAVDAVVLVVPEGAPLQDLSDAKRILTMSGTPIIGYIFNRATARSGASGYGYGAKS